MMSRSPIWVLVLVHPVLLVGCARAQQAQVPPEQLFRQLDRDGDGKISKREANNPRFDVVDADHDGFVTLLEWKAYLNRAALQQLDTDGDGRISQQEFNALYQDAERYFRTRQQMAQPADGHALPDPLPAKPDPLGLTFTQDFVPGTTDPEGHVLAGTEANQLVAHRGWLFASFGATYRHPPTPDPDFHGYAIWRKETANGPWQVDLDLGPHPFRLEVMASVTFTTDAEGRNLDQPASRLVAARWSPNQSILVRDDGSGEWVESQVLPEPALPPGGVFTARSFGNHLDTVTRVHHVFAGAWQGHGGAVGEYRSAIYRAAYDPEAPGGLRWSPEPELQGVGRVMAFAECNGDLYAACCILDESPLSGGVFRRMDGPQPRWELVYRWKEYDLAIHDDEQRMMRGLTAIPDPNGTGREVLIGFRYFPEPVIERIDPQQGHKVTVELNLAEYFGQAFHGGGKYAGPIRCAYNPFTAFTDPRTDETVYLAGVQAYHPGFPSPPFNGSHYLVRHLNGTYDWGMVFDPDHPPAPGRSLDTTRRICVSPFPEDRGRVLYFAGYDAPYADNQSAWICRATPPAAEEDRP
jgi:hypothetical protein